MKLGRCGKGKKSMLYLTRNGRNIHEIRSWRLYLGSLFLQLFLNDLFTFYKNLIAGHWERQLRSGVPGQAGGDRRDGGHQEGAAGQALQEPRAADHAAARALQHRQAHVFLLHLRREEGRDLPGKNQEYGLGGSVRYRNRHLQ